MKTIVYLAVLLTAVSGLRAQTSQISTNDVASSTNNVAVPKSYSETPDYAAISKRLDEIEKPGQAGRVDVVKTQPDILYTKSVNYSGLLVHVIKTPKSGNLLQLFNPFAPPEYDTHRPANQFNATMLTARSRPHAFTDERTHEPSGFTLVSAGF